MTRRTSIPVARLVAVAAILLAATAHAQGVPASVTSYGFGGHNGPQGVPPSVNSPGFGQPFRNNNNAFGNNGFGFNNGFNNQHGGFVGVPVYVVPGYPSISEPYLGYSPNAVALDSDGYVVPVSDSSESVREQARRLHDYETQLHEQLREQLREDERRLNQAERTRSHRSDQSQDPQREPVAAAPPPAPDPQPTSTLVYRDGHQADVSNYAIVGDTLFDLSTAAHPHKIALAELDLPATVKLNEDHGIDFQLPKATP